ncbi:glycosyltransferase [Allokutzneria sp. A3M-2-11 16]|uniref:glycosyltransferase n=1 Tax=Allokutzneria sp. A3M-2-11 16 TaxID=2962043 RepID=UPI0020B65983|nr:glycosyltransferase [Allokutzneria sp. A3M-2-11 16]MCP3798464.1 glycosyltransferase [Allokutzneria sp. A3M-2-11 16]
MVRISVIIPTRNRAADLTRCLAGLVESVEHLAVWRPDAHLHEVVIVDDASDAPREIERVAHRATEDGLAVSMLRNARRRGAGASRERAAAEATGDVLAFLDDDAVPRGDWLSVVGGLDRERPAVTGRVFPFDRGLVSAARQARYDARYDVLDDGAPVEFFAGGNSAVLTDSFTVVGGFSRSGVGGDNSLAEALAEHGTPVRFDSNLVIVHRNGKGFRQAVLDSWAAGLHHPKPISMRAAARMSASSAVGARRGVREVNRLLGIVHAAARLVPRIAVREGE